ncbi:hypothetical protein TEA_027162 [Camellia sinensis var. sinensis]|uniref:Trigger factor ribosome-binding bacterial domain-containing protein n=1 Tax=Camellia sinensis var. sinensis TaxID=542762 RepID=A0A4S4E7N8_CAMSN|nr:hypothetical protein TEA_027162 [Camellia sinensis var. sinensis]
MATITMVSQFQCSTKFTIRSLCKHVQTNHNATSIDLCTVKHNICGRQLSLHSSSREGLRCLSKPISAVGSGLEVSTDPKDNAITIKNVKILVEYREDDKIQLRVDLTGNETQKVFDQVLTDLARSAPPIPGFRRQKGVWVFPKEVKELLFFALQRAHVGRRKKACSTNLLSCTIHQENLNVKDKKINTVQTAEELKSLFAPGNEFGFNATLEIENLESETTSS